MKNFVDFTMKQINDFQKTLMRGEAEANGRFWSYEAQIWCTTRSICQEIESDCLSDDSYRLLHEDAIDWVKTQIEKVGKAVVTDDDFAEKFRDMGYTTHLIHKKDKDGVPYEYILIYEPEEGEEPRDEEWEIRDPEPIEICYGDPITEEDLKELEDNEMWSFDEGTKEWCFEGKHIHAYYIDPYYQSDEGRVEVSIFAINAEGHPVAHTDHIMLDPKVADALIEDIEENPQDYLLQSYPMLDAETGEVCGEAYGLLHRLEKMPFDKNGVHATGFEYLEVNGDWVLEYEDDIPEEYHPKYIYFSTGRDSQY